MSAAFNVLFLCTRNSARSLMAQAILDRLGRGKFNAYSAGSHPARNPMPAVIDKLETLGHDVSGLRSLLSFLTETCCGGRPELCGDLARLLPDDPPEEEPMTAAFNVLFLCTHNSARSLMAQAILERIGKGKFNAYSAGSEPAPSPMREVIDKLKTLGHDVSGLRCKSWDEFTGPDAPHMDFVITLCDVLQGQDCPDVGDKPVTAAWPLPDPAKFQGTPTERATMINELYGMIRRRLEIFINLPYASLDRIALKKRLDELGDSSRAPV